MTYRVIYKGEEGRNFASDFCNNVAKTNFIEVLTRAGIQYEVETIGERKFRVCRVVFDIRDVEPALKDPNYKYSYTFGDPHNFSEKHKIVKGKCSSGEVKPVIVIQSWLDTESNIIALREKLKTEGKLRDGHLSLIVGAIT